MEKYDAYRENNTIGGQDMVQELVRGQQVQVAEQYQVQIQANKFTVYYTDTNALYISAYLVREYGIEPKGPSITVDDIAYIQVYKEDIDYRVTETKGALQPEYKYYETKKDKKPLDYAYADDGITKKNYYTYYEDLENNELYINEDILKLLGLTAKEDPKIIQGKNCYPITKEQIDEIRERTGYIGQKQSLLKNHEQKEIGVCEFNGDVFIPENAIKKYKDITDRRIKVDGEIYMKIGKEDLVNLKKAYSHDNIDLKLKELTIKPKNSVESTKNYIDSDLANMLKETSTTPFTEPPYEK